ncbi:TonB-dependent receptor plug domain-containing protein [Hahella ganghwensis]|uniref:TonB-dependent receptor plug domain-containing protein n=1 Tax=Hahella ganghwensis TaxID=286420 RepID=UPI000368A8F0|nr:TonB-dependent receptor [Hahella ganghwensis]
MNKLKILTLLMAGLPTAAHGVNDDFSDDGLWDLSPEELGQIRVTSIASGTPTPLDKAAAITTVITANDIEAMAATDLDEVLETVPGLHVTRSQLAYAPRYVIRGIASANNPQTLVLINGIPVTNLALGNRGNVWAGMPLKSIAKIEVIRGPGSALYGADAFAGVINIQTKGPEDIDNLKVGVGYGSFDTKSSWFQFGSNEGPVKFAASVEYETTDGHQGKIGEDAQTLNDQNTGTSASNAPGPVNTMRDSVEARFEVGYDDITVRLGYQGRYNIGTGPGLIEAIDNNGRFASNRYNFDITHQADEIIEDFSVVTQLSYYQDSQEVEENVQLFPPGTLLAGTFPDGFIGNPGYKEEIVRLNFNSLYKGFDAHLVRIGVGASWGDVYEVTESKNFNPDFTPKPGGITSVDDTDEVWLPEKDRTSYFVYLQDEWKFAQDWQLISGVRYDYYSDFGDTTNPRLSLIWAATDDLTAKLLYGRAFRAPSIEELFVTSNPVTLGNQDLSPEIIDSYELGIAYQVNKQILLSANIFHYEIKDFINFVDIGNNRRQAQNIGTRSGQGGELELSYEVNDQIMLVSNYAYQKSTDKRTEEDVGSAPNHQLYARVQFDTQKNVLFSAEVNWVGEQSRAANDDRDPTPSYTTIDLKYTQQNLLQGMDLILTLRNLSDKDVREPSPAGTITPTAIPGDYPMVGRSLLAEIEYSF